jgi:hypothetical protein
LAALAARLITVQRLLRPLLGPALRCCLAAYRSLAPLWLRRLFWRSWPPRVKESHVSPALAALLARPAGKDAAELAAAGFNGQGALANRQAQEQRLQNFGHLQQNTPVLPMLPRWSLPA